MMAGGRIVATLFLAVGVPLTVIAQEPPQIPAIARFQRVNVRSGPGIDFTRIGQIESGEQLRATGRSDEGNNWLRIDFGSVEGWVAYFTLRVAGDAAMLPIVEASSPERIIRQPDDIQVQVFRIVNVRSEPAIQSDKIGQLFPGDDVALLGRDSENRHWLLIETDDLVGWIAYFTVTVIGDVNRLAIVTQETDSDSLIFVTRPSADGVMAHAFRSVNVRQGPGIQFDPIGQLAGGDAVDVIGRSDETNNWLQIDYAGQAGWIAYFTVTVAGNPNALPVVETTS